LTIVHSVSARNAATSSENRIHDNDIARSYGFGGGLVPGVTLYGYLMGPVLEHYGREWLESGQVSVRFLSPAYEGELVDAALEPADVGGCALSLRGPAGEERVSGWAGLAQDPMPGSDGVDAVWARSLSLPRADLPVDRPPADAENLAANRALGTLWEEPVPSLYQGYLDLLEPSDVLGLCHSGPLHPGRMILSANSILAANVRLGPWVHVGSQLVNLAPVPRDSVLEVRARVHRRFEAKGHELATLDVQWLVGDQTVMAGRHTAIYRLRAASGPASTSS
jgi:hypothetical protein